MVDKADKIYVKLSTDPDDQSEHGRPAHVIGVDPETDIAVIKIDNAPPNLPTVKLGNSDGAQVGDWVLAIGSPFSLSETVTAGIVSAKNRSIEDNPNGPPNQFQKFIQTDAAINPGNSGGPLVDMAGQVIGMNTAIYTQSMGSQGVGFAMPSNIIAGHLQHAHQPGAQGHPRSIGISFQAIPPNSAVRTRVRLCQWRRAGRHRHAQRPCRQGRSQIRRRHSFPSTANPSRTAINWSPTSPPARSARPSSSACCAMAQTSTVTVGIADRAKLFTDNENASVDDSAPTEADAGDTKLGIKVDAIPAQLASKIGVKGGVIVTSVRPGSFADEINLTKGAVITAINKQAVTDISSYRAIVAGLKPGADVVFEVRGSNSAAAAGPAFVWGTLP